MHSRLLSLLACPLCHSDLILSIERGTHEFIENGFFQCQSCHKKYVIKDDIPLFSPVISDSGVRNQRDTYSTWWDDYHDASSITQEGTADFFFNSLKIKADEMKGRLVLDAGCGNGRFSYVVSHYQPDLLVAFDLSSGVLHARKAISQHNPHACVAYVQGDITNPPFKKGSFDVVFSWGVIHHTPDTLQTFTQISQLVKEGGRLGVYVYEFHPLYQYNRQVLSLVAYLRSLLLIRPFRFFCSRLPSLVVHLLFIPIYHLERLLGFGIMGCHGPSEDPWNKDRYFRVVIDRFKTRYASEHQLEEVIGWFRRCGFNRLKVGWRPRVSVSGIKECEGKPSILDMEISDCHEVDETLPQIFSDVDLKKTA